MKRRDLLSAIAGAAALAPVRALGALTPTPVQSRGPFYPDRLPLDRDNDLVQVEGRLELALGEITGNRTAACWTRTVRPYAGPWWRSGSAMPMGAISTGATAVGVPGIRDSRATGDSRPAPTGATASAPSSRSPIPDGPPTSTLPSRHPGADQLVTQMYVARGTRVRRRLAAQRHRRPGCPHRPDRAFPRHPLHHRRPQRALRSGARGPLR